MTRCKEIRFVATNCDEYSKSLSRFLVIRYELQSHTTSFSHSSLRHAVNYDTLPRTVIFLAVIPLHNLLKLNFKDNFADFLLITMLPSVFVSALLKRLKSQTKEYISKYPSMKTKKIKIFLLSSMTIASSGRHQHFNLPFCVSLFAL